MEFLSTLVSKLIDLIEQWGYLGIALAVTLEYACIPIPSEVILPFIGILASQNSFSYLGVILVSVVAGIFGSIICYLIGYYGGNPLILSLTKRFPKTKKSTIALNKWFEKHGKLAVLFARLFPLTRTYVSFIAGAAKFNSTIFILYSLVGITLWNTVLITLGYLLGENWTIIESLMKQYSATCAVIALIIIVVIIFKEKFNLKKS
ncbi:DedA family protein [Clostridium sp. UBA6640]|uniref:DedA family protein n=1 Tax=Clostridium sp. UBA6640 TaxID=1946370 RepID=UPI0025BDCBD6|nr:DedA family protein [Clostridium sp. UBA6640]